MVKHDWKLEELHEIYKMPLLDLVYRAAQVHRTFHDPQEVQLCHLVSVKTGGCSEDCKYCSQSARYQTDVKAEKLMDFDEVIKRAQEAKKNGTTRVCLGAAWRQVRNNKQFEQILKMVKAISEMGLEVCCTLGMLDKDQAKRLKEAGLYAYNHNLDTSEKYYDKIITTRKYGDRLKTLAHVREANISVCCGGIIGLGEKVEDRLSMIQTLASFDPHPESVPINRLVPIPGTPLGIEKQIPVWELVRTIATARVAMPKSMVRLAAGRLQMTHAEQSLCFLAGANSIFVGEKLLTAPNPAVDSDRELFQTLQLKTRSAYKTDESFLVESLNKRKIEGNLRDLLRHDGSLIDLTSNDYLGFARSIELSDSIEKEYRTLVNEDGIRPHIGATGSRLLTGNGQYVEILEDHIAKFHHAESCLIFNSGYVANIGLLSSVIRKQDCIIFDSQVHASTWDGTRLSGARTLLFSHNDLNHLERQLKRAQSAHNRIFICVESLYSMKGSVAPLREMSDLAEKYSAHLIVDEAHATGIFGPDGKGLVVECGIEEKVFARIHTFGKALGAHGAAVLGTETLRKYLINFSKTFIYTTAFPLHSFVNIMCVYKKLKTAKSEREQLRRLIHYFQMRVKDAGPTPIQSIKVKGSHQADAISLQLRQAGFDVRAIKSPTVRKGDECLRVCLHSFNTFEHIDLLLTELSNYEQLDHCGNWN